MDIMLVKESLSYTKGNITLQKNVRPNLQMDIMLVMKILVLCMARDLPLESSLYPPYTISYGTPSKLVASLANLF